jgi:streptogramin lyase
MYIIDGGLFREITAAGNVSTVPLSISGSASRVNPEGICTDISGNVYITDGINHNVGKVAASGQVTIVSGSHYFTSPWGIAADNNGNLFVGDNGLYKITSSNIVSQFNIGTAGLSLQQLEGVAVDSQGNVYITDSEPNGGIAKVTPAGVMSIYAGSIEAYPTGTDGLANLAGFTFPVGVVVDSKGNIFVADAYSVREIAFQ